MGGNIANALQLDLLLILHAVAAPGGFLRSLETGHDSNSSLIPTTELLILPTTSLHNTE